ncbi:gluconate 2-dehydrogenase subunit 3 family protein [Pedobacter sp. HMF7647]|uniref:Gluconate 2-dehydrogenase subunit 3 family protein n=1 Tax=Hufsiella arboris TaxID=2695275 RepID=A0A7K1Y884_9SPHI|nr:gluconate 2-dehydrogenase subunit 3 family protein [Hufsiella arboris]MXV50258.1 gluconate 2-dehydrogenase subunit 3 family protein [Hufsiella arboris]
MNRRESLKALGIATISTGVLVESCKTDKKPQTDKTTGTADEAGRQDYEVERDKKLKAERFFNDHEMATITVLCDIIIPKDAKSGSASDAGVPDFIEFISKDILEHQLPLRGGLKWLDLQALNRFEKPFKDCAEKQQLTIVDEIAYPNKAKPEMQQGVAFFSRMRSLTASGFFSSKMGVEDIGYVGNAPNKWEGVPADVIAQYGLQNV